MSLLDIGVSARIDIAHEAMRRRLPGETAHDALIRLLNAKADAPNPIALHSQRSGKGQVKGRTSCRKSQVGKTKGKTR